MTSPLPASPNIRLDVLAGLSVAGLLLPESVAYAGIAGLAPQHAIVAAIAGLTLYFFLGDSRFAIVSPTSSSAAIMAAAVAVVPDADPAHKATLAAALVLSTGALFALFSFARLGQLSSFISRPVLRGFAFGLALTITLKQLPLAFGIEGAGGDVYHLLSFLGAHIGDINPVSLAVAAIALALLIGLDYVPGIPAAFAVLVIGILASLGLNLSAYKVALVGEIDFSGLGFSLPDLPLRDWLDLGETAFALLVIIYAEAWGAMRSLALRHGDSIDPNRALLALGVANIVSSLLRGMPVGAGFSASSANEAAGAQSRFAGLVAGLAVLVLILTCRSFIAKLPEPVLAAVVIAALTHALDPRPLIKLFRLGRDQYLALATVFAVLAFGILHGMIFAVGLSLIAALHQFAKPQIRVLGRLGDSHDYVDLDRHPEAKGLPGISMIRPEEPLFFANTERVFAAIRTLIAQQVGIKVIILSLEETTDLDSTALEAMQEFALASNNAGMTVLLARIKENVRDLLVRAGSGALSDDEHCFYSVADAADAAERRSGSAQPAK
jgi:high affinity sulfate transporter 1